MASSIFSRMQEAYALSDEQLNLLVKRSPHSYKVYSIPKKSGGNRQIAQPAKETKYLQYWLIENVFSLLPVHECASAYHKGASVKSNAAAHSKNQYLSKFDFRNFFPSIVFSDLVRHFEKHLNDHVQAADILLIARLACIRPKGTSNLCLSIGAPSSPILSNSIMYEFDERISGWCKDHGIVYTRYADDLAFSTNIKSISYAVEKELREVLAGLQYPKLVLHAEKTIHVSKKYQRKITGVVINNQNALSIGREKKRIVSSLIHRFALNGLSDADISRAQGLLGFAHDVEPLFVVRMRQKYGFRVIDQLLSFRVQSEEKK